MRQPGVSSRIGRQVGSLVSVEQFLEKKRWSVFQRLSGEPDCRFQTFQRAASACRPCESSHRAHRIVLDFAAVRANTSGDGHSTVSGGKHVAADQQGNILPRFLWTIRTSFLQSTRRKI